MFKKMMGARPSPALVVSLIALFVSLGGVGYAAVTVTGKNVKNSSLTGKDVKNSSLTGSDIKNSSLGGADVKNNNLKGSDILESSLGTVPSATNATNATNAANAGNADSVGGVRVARLGTFSLTDNQTREILRVGPLTFTADCQINNAGNDTAEILIATSQDHAAFDGDDTEADLLTTTPATDRQYAEDSLATGTPEIDSQSDGSAVAPDGTQISSILYTSVNILNQPGTCRFGGVFFIG